MKPSFALACLWAFTVIGCEAVAGYDQAPAAETGPPDDWTTASCRNTDEDPLNCGNCGARCRDDQQCAKGACTCRAGLVSCGGKCVDTASDVLNCGSCGKSCIAGQACSAGKCRDTCVGNATGCPVGSTAACVHLDGPLDCGGCGIACATNEVCAASSCRQYGPAGTCKTCPCETCGAGSKCCLPPPGHTYAICVSGDACP